MMAMKIQLRFKRENNVMCTAIYQQDEKQEDIDPDEYKSTTKTDRNIMEMGVRVWEN